VLCRQPAIVTLTLSRRRRHWGHRRDHSHIQWEARRRSAPSPQTSSQDVTQDVTRTAQGPAHPLKGMPGLASFSRNGDQSGCWPV
jgi:hypothetical protein